jgi:hypothetical protein
LFRIPWKRTRLSTHPEEISQHQPLQSRVRIISRPEYLIQARKTATHRFKKTCHRPKYLPQRPTSTLPNPQQQLKTLPSKPKSSIPQKCTNYNTTLQRMATKTQQNSPEPELKTHLCSHNLQLKLRPPQKPTTLLNLPHRIIP